MNLRRMIIFLLILAAGALDASAEDGGVRSLRPRFFFESGAFAGGEQGIERYQESWYRIYSELGFEFWSRRPEELRKGGIGLAVSGSLGRDDYRFGVGPRATYRLQPRWALQGSLHLLWSSKEEELGLFDRGWQVRAGLLYDDLLSFDLLWSVLPYEYREPEPERGNMHSLYGGLMLHGKPGAITSSALAAVLAGITVWILVTGLAY
jgi:hypothetical protein